MQLLTKRAPELAAIPAFQPVPDTTLRRIGRLFERKTFMVDELVIAEGDHGDDVFVVVSGEAVVTRCGGVIAALGPGDWFGELAVLLDVPRNATVRATTPLEVFVLDRASFFTLIADVPYLWRHLASILARRLRAADVRALTP